MTDLAKQSNPFSTGGGGPNFETRIQAAFAVLMLAGQPAPCLPSFPISKLKLQGRYDGFHTDDFIVFANDYHTDNEAKLLGQIKHDITITTGNETFAEVIVSAWSDFNDDDFIIGRDAFALVTGPLSKVDTNHVRPILEWARFSGNEEEFIQKLNTEGFSSQKKQEKLEAFQTQLRKANAGNELDNRQLWGFLRSFHLIGYDFDVAASSDLSLIKAFISQCTDEPAESVWGEVLSTIQMANQNAGTVSVETFGQGVKQAFNSVNSSEWLRDRRKLEDHAATVLGRIRNTTGSIHIAQSDYLASLVNKAEAADFIIVTGERGAGKSGLVQTFVQQLDNSVPVFCFSAEDFNFPHLDHAFTAINLQGSLKDLAARLALIPRKYLVIESLEKLLELEHTTAFTDLLQFIKKSGDWKIIASCRDYAVQQVMRHHLLVNAVSSETLPLNGFNDEQLHQLGGALPKLVPLLNNPNLKPLIKIPFFADLAFRVLETGREFSNDDGEQEFREAVWCDVIAKEQDRRNGMPTKRKKAFVDIAVKRAKQMVYGVPENNFDSDVAYKLEEDHVIYRDSERNLLIPAHDVLEDWAIAHYIENAYSENSDDVSRFTEVVGNEPAITRSYRLWLHQKLSSQDDISDFVYEILTNSNTPGYWKDETISAILQSDSPDRFLDSLSGRLFENEFELLKRFCFVLRVACQIPHPDFNLSSNSDDAINALWLIPSGSGWGSVIRFLNRHKEQLPEAMVPHIAKLLNDWSSLLHIDKPIPEVSREAGVLALHLLEPFKESYRDNDEGDRKTLLSIIIKTASKIEGEFIEILESDVFIARSGKDSSDRLPYVDGFCEQIFSYIESAYVSKYFPDLMIRLANYEWFVPAETYDESDPFLQDSDSGGTAKFFELHEYRHDFSPASGLKGPFHHLLRYHWRIGLDFILAILNRAAKKYAYSGLDGARRSKANRLDYPEPQVGQVIIRLNDGSKVSQYASGKLWGAYQGHSVVPDLLQSALMAMENWLIDTIEKLEEETVSWLFEYILKESNSVMPTAVLASLTVGYSNRIGKTAFPLLRQYELYSLDLDRASLELVYGRSNEHGGLSQEDFSELYHRERKMASERSWRQDSLEAVIINFQFIEEFRDQALDIVDTLRKIAPKHENVGFMLNRIDSRGWTPRVDVENNRVIFEANQLEGDLKEIQQRSEEERKIPDRFTTLLLWSAKVLAREKSEREYYSSWQEALSEAKTLSALLDSGEVDVNKLGLSPAGVIVKSAAIFIRDFGDELTAEDVDWCADLIIMASTTHSDSENRFTTSDVGDYDGAAACANLLPILFDYSSSEEERNVVKEAIVLALTHNNANVRNSAAVGAREYLWERDADFAEICITSTIEYARFDKQEFRDEYRRTYHEKNREAVRAKLQAKKDAFRIKFARSQVVLTDCPVSLDSHCARHILTPCLMIPDGSVEPGHVDFFTQMLSMFFTSEQKGHSEQDDMIHLNHRVAFTFSQRFAQYFFSLHNSDDYVEKLNEGCEAAPDFLKYLILCFSGEAEKNQQEIIYWNLWGKLFDTMKSLAISTANHERDRYSRDKRINLLRRFLKADTPWQNVDEDVQLMKTGERQVIKFCKDTAMHPDVFEALASLMHYFPKLFFDQGIHILAKFQKNEADLRLLSGINTAFYLEKSIQRFLQRDQRGALPRKVHVSCLILLDAVVNTGSAVAYSLREHLVRSRRIL